MRLERQRMLAKDTRIYRTWLPSETFSYNNGAVAMTIWLVRAGGHGEFEEKFLSEERIYVTWDRLDVDLGAMQERDETNRGNDRALPGFKTQDDSKLVSQVWPFAHRMAPGDWVVMPSKQQPSIFVGEITDTYNFNPAGEDPFFHWRSVEWIGKSIPRSHFGQDLLYSFGAFMTICRIQRNNAEERLKAMRANDWQPEANTTIISPDEDQGDGRSIPKRLILTNWLAIKSRG